MVFLTSLWATWMHGGHACPAPYEHPQTPLQAVFSQWGRKCWRSAGLVDIQATPLYTWSLNRQVQTSTLFVFLRGRAL
ncbi:hypothetical protein F5883DRAFT_202141 [Diaporthe sp. PMI_573]|nr:hypothetical protein F5883DRAFT_202141 [Diaporthaceae sp. PMI_573]